VPTVAKRLLYDAARQKSDVFVLELLMAAIRFIYTTESANPKVFSGERRGLGMGIADLAFE
jgi:hypothetical protein